MNNKDKFKLTEIGMIPEDWEVKKISDTCSIIREQFTPNFKDIRNYIGLEHIEQGSLRLIGIGKSSDAESNKFVFKKGQILFGKLRPYFRKVYRPDFDGVCSTDILVIDGKRGFDNGYLFYFFANPNIIDEATRSSDGTKMPRASWAFMSRLERAFPELMEQAAIAKILSDLDSKIENNLRMNNTLETIGQALFKRWFVDFEFPSEKGRPYKSSGGKMVDSELGEIPKGWRVGSVSDCGRVVCGKTPPTKDKENYGEDFPFITIPDMHHKTFIINTERKLSRLGAGTQSKKELPALSICVSCIATPGIVTMTTEKSHTNVNAINIVTSEPVLC